MNDKKMDIPEPQDMFVNMLMEEGLLTVIVPIWLLAYVTNFMEHIYQKSHVKLKFCVSDLKKIKEEILCYI